MIHDRTIKRTVIISRLQNICIKKSTRAEAAGGVIGNAGFQSASQNGCQRWFS